MAVDHQNLTEDQRDLRSTVIYQFDRAMEGFYDAVERARTWREVSVEDAAAIIDHYAGGDVADGYLNWLAEADE